MVQVHRSVIRTDLCAKLARDVSVLANAVFRESSVPKELSQALEFASPWIKQYNFAPLDTLNLISEMSGTGELLKQTVARLLPRKAKPTNYCGFFIAFEGTQRPAFDWHCDAQYDGAKAGFNAWIPMQDCGIDRPSLQTIKGNRATPKAIAKATKHICKAGDMVLMTPFTMHATFFPEAVIHRDRVALVLRYETIRVSALESIRQMFGNAVKKVA